jgi:putative ABC transport system substrate-binding protein
MRRRTFIAGTVALLGAPLAAQAQQSPNPAVGFLSIASAASWAPLVTAFRQGLTETGYVEGTNVGIEFRWAEHRPERLPALAADLARRKVAVLVATGGPNVALAAKAATPTVPIVFTLGGDPVKLGLVASLGRPGGNITGVTFITGPLHAKRLQLLHEVVPRASVVALLVNPDNPLAEVNIGAVQDAARSFGGQTRVLKAHTVPEIDAAFAALTNLRTKALFVASDGLFFDQREQVVALATRHAVPASYDLREFVTAGGLMSYGASLSEVYRQAGVYAGKVLSGVRPADLPVLQPTKLEFVINLKTAKALGLTIPPSVLARADEVIQ